MKYFILFILGFSLSTSATELDEKLKTYIERFNFAPVKISGEINPALFALGKEIFFDKELSGNRNISCSTCHSPEFGTGDGLVLSLGQGAHGDGDKRVATNIKQITPRHSPTLYNLGHDDITDMFWDGRVSYSKRHLSFKTPEPGLNGDYPEYFEIVDELDSVLAAQALFPILSHTEMRGNPGDNELSDESLTNFEVWSLVMKRLLTHKKYEALFAQAYGTNIHLNIGHLAKALGHYQKFAFIVDQTPWDKYLRGDLLALSLKEKRGALAFVEKGLCANCHNGALLGGVGFFNVVSPQVGPGRISPNNDEGLKETTGRDVDAYRFKIPMLRNVAKSAPYFHSGAYTTLSQVVEHYTKGRDAINLYDSSVLSDFEENNFKNRLFVETDKYKIMKKQLTAHPLLQSRMIILTDEDKKLIEYFLTTSLTQN